MSALFAGASCVGIAVLTTATVSAQTAGPVADGDFSGVISVDGQLSFPIGDGGADGALIIGIAGQGPLEISLREGAMDGTWQMTGTTTTNGGFATAQGSISIEGGGTIEAGGAMSGPPTDYRMTGSVSTTQSVTVNVPGVGAQSATASDSAPVDLSLTDVLVTCGGIYGRWDYQVRQAIAAQNINGFVRGYFSSSTGVDATEQADEVAALTEDVARWAGEAPGVEPGDGGLFIGRALSLLDRAQQLQSEIAAPTPCPPDPLFATQLTLAAQDVLSNLIATYPGITNPTIVALAAGSGAIGSGSAAPETADALQAQMEADVQAKYEEAIENFPDLTTDDDLIDIARTAEMLGMESLVIDGGGDLSPSDILLVFGAGS